MERPRVPGEEVVYRFLGLHRDPAVQLLFRDRSELHQELSQPLPLLTCLLLDCGGQILSGDRPIAYQELTQSIGAIEDGGMDHRALLQVDVAEVRPVGQRQTPRLAPQCEQLTDVRQVDVSKRALDCHQSASTTILSSMSCHSHTTRSGLGNQAISPVAAPAAAALSSVASSAEGSAVAVTTSSSDTSRPS